MELYKYKKIDDNFFNMLNEQYLYCSETKYFDDVFDGKMPFEFDINEEDITPEFTKNLLEREYNYFVSNRRFNEKQLLKKIQQLVAKINLSEITSESVFPIEESEEISQLNNIYTKLHSVFSCPQIISLFQSYLKTLLSIQKQLRICSLSSIKDNQVLWSMYADNFKGACIEYEIDKKLPKRVIYQHRDDYDPLFRMMEMIYNQKSIHKNTTDCIENTIKNLLLSKDPSWKFQKEYRVMIFNDTPEIEEKNKVSCKIKAIYLGYKISEDNRNKILSACRNKFALKEMKINHYMQTFDFSTIKTH